MPLTLPPRLTGAPRLTFAPSLTLARRLALSERRRCLGRPRRRHGQPLTERLRRWPHDALGHAERPLDLLRGADLLVLHESDTTVPSTPARPVRPERWT